MSCTRNPNMIRPIAAGSAFAILALGLALSGCVQAPGNMQADFGASVRQNVAAQVADPDAHYKRLDQPASSGSRTALAQDRYNKGKVIQPATPSASSVAIKSGGEGKE